MMNLMARPVGLDPNVGCDKVRFRSPIRTRLGRHASARSAKNRFVMHYRAVSKQHGKVAADGEGVK